MQSRGRASRARHEPAQQLQQWLIASVALIAALLFWRGTRDIFSLVRLSAVMVVALLVVGLTAFRAQKRPTPFGDRRVVVVVGAFGAIALVVSLLADSPGAALFGPYGRFIGGALYVAGAAVLLFGHAVLDRVGVRRLLFAFFVGLAGAVAYGLAQGADLDPFEWRGAQLSTKFSTFGQINFAAGWVATVTPVAVWVALSKENATWLRVVGGVVAAGAAAYMAVAQSLQGPLALIVGLGVMGVVWWLASRRERDTLSRRDVIVGVAVLLVGLGVAIGIAQATGELSDGMRERRLLWRAAVEMAVDEPVAGRGFAGYSRAFTQYRSVEHAELLGNTVADDPHSVPLNILVSGGVLLFVAYAALVVVTGIALVRSARRARGPDIPLVAVLAGMWTAYHAQSLVSFDMPALAATHFAVAAAILAMELATRAGAGEGRPLLLRVPAPAAWVTVAGLLAIAWFALIPLRADVIAQDAADAARRGDAAESGRLLADARSLAGWEGHYAAAHASVLVGQRRLEDALAAGQRAAELSPGAIQYALTTAQLARQMDRPEVAAKWYRLAAQRDPNNAGVVIVAAEFFVERRDTETAVALLRHAASVAGENADVWYRIGGGYEALGRTEDAAAARERAAALESSTG